jgi:hypothetical protein
MLMLYSRLSPRVSERSTLRGRALCGRRRWTPLSRSLEGADQVPDDEAAGRERPLREPSLHVRQSARVCSSESASPLRFSSGCRPWTRTIRSPQTLRTHSRLDSTTSDLFDRPDMLRLQAFPLQHPEQPPELHRDSCSLRHQTARCDVANPQGRVKRSNAAHDERSARPRTTAFDGGHPHTRPLKLGKGVEVAPPLAACLRFAPA